MDEAQPPAGEDSVELRRRDGSQCPLHLSPLGSDLTSDSRLRVQVGAELWPVPWKHSEREREKGPVQEANVGHDLRHP